MDIGSGDGWVSFQEPPHDKKVIFFEKFEGNNEKSLIQTHSQQMLGDRLPFPVTLATLDEKLTNSDVEFVEVGDYHFRTVGYWFFPRIDFEFPNFRYKPSVWSVKWREKTAKPHFHCMTRKTRRKRSMRCSLAVWRWEKEKSSLNFWKKFFLKWKLT